MVVRLSALDRPGQSYRNSGFAATEQFVWWRVISGGLQPFGHPETSGGRQLNVNCADATRNLGFAQAEKQRIKL